MLHTARDNDKLAGMDGQVAIAQFDGQRAFDHKKEFIFIVVMMPHKFAFYLDQFDMRIVQLADYARVLIVGNEGEFVFEIDNRNHSLLKLSRARLPMFQQHLVFGVLIA